MSSKLNTIVRELRRYRNARRRPAVDSRLGRGPHGVSAVAVVRRLVHTLRTRAGSSRR
ncbi:hypothetical protein HW130_13955 [Streptomyces sp. PKU-EA00015]|uniref:hypothetical protein n=1 Tax=Streptomyces sp. PKU-EA00015 TaxID=2748326 RepID=UPI0015A003C8|nr:hypothetical protein [Streptomyces sp. PKU-EA00015]NWF27362.1 hypothetical protein [Streptomyces sp. PKU-EA00015]